MPRVWYAYNGSGPINSVDSYLIISGTPNCLAGRILCAIKATFSFSDPTKPHTISTNLQNYIANGIAVGGPQPASPVGTKPYVYFCPNS